MKASSLVLTHLGIAIVGLVAARTTIRPQNEALPAQKSKANSASLSSQQAAATRSKGSSKRPQSLSRRDFEQMWQTLPEQVLSNQDRIIAQQRLLHEWAKVDLEGAMKAALLESWENEFGQRPYRRSGPLARAFAKEFSRDPERSWNLIQSGKFGAGASLLRHTWYQALQASNPEFLVQKLAEVPVSDLKVVVRKISNSEHHLKDTKDKVLAALLNLPEHYVALQDLKPFLPDPNSAEIKETLAKRNDFSERERKMLVSQLIGKRTLYSSDEGIPQIVASLQESAEGLPSNIKGEIFFQALVGSQEDRFYSSPSHAESTLQLIDLMIENENWAYLEKQQTQQRLHLQTKSLPDGEVAAWAANLPEREELTGLFHRGVDDYIRDNMDSAWDWIQEFPPGRWRDRAFAEYSQQALHIHGDNEASRRALDAIADPDFQREAESWRAAHLQQQARRE